MNTERNPERYVVEGGAVVDELGGLLYESHVLRGLSASARHRLAELHTEDEELDWEGAEEILIAEGYIMPATK